MVRSRKLLVLAVVMAIAVAFAPAQVSADNEGAPSWNAPSVSNVASQVAPFDAQSSALRMVGGLFLCLGLFGFAVHVYRRYVLPRTVSVQRRLQIVERIQLTQKSALVLVKLDNREFIMSTGTESSRLVPLTGRHEELFDETLNGACQEVGEYNA